MEVDVGPEEQALGLVYPALSFNPAFAGALREDRCHTRVELASPPDVVAREIRERRHVGRHELIERGWADGQIVPSSRAEARLVSGEMRVGLWHLNPAAVNVYLLPAPGGGSTMYAFAVAREGLYRSRGAHEAVAEITKLAGVTPGRPS